MDEDYSNRRYNEEEAENAMKIIVCYSGYKEGIYNNTAAHRSFFSSHGFECNIHNCRLLYNFSELKRQDATWNCTKDYWEEQLRNYLKTDFAIELNEEKKKEREKAMREFDSSLMSRFSNSSSKTKKCITF